jgi:hypothetical protein
MKAATNNHMAQNTGEYHGIIINRSQADHSIFNKLEIIGKRKSLFGLLTLYKTRVQPEKIDATIKLLQSNMASRLFLKKQEFYSHFYRNNELIVVFRDAIFKISPDKSTWKDAIAHGRSLKIADKQLDFTPNTFENETY